MARTGLFTRRYDVNPEMLLDFLQQAMAQLPSIASYELADSLDGINFTTSLTFTSWGENMVATVDGDGGDGSIVTISGEPRVGMLSTPWGEELHAATIENQLVAALDPSIQMARSNPIVMLQADHRRVEALFARIQVADDGERAELVNQLLMALRVHMALEEGHVYPLLEREVDADLAEEAEVEHQLARDGLAQLEELTPDEAGFDAALTMVIAGIEHHVAEEESEAFPRLASQLGPDRLTRLAEQLTTVRAQLLQQELNPQDTDREQQEAREQREKDKAREQREKDKAREQQNKRDSKAPRPPRPKQKSDRQRTPRSKRKPATINPDDTTKADLIQQAKRAGVSGYSHMSKSDLAKAITRAKS
jgi:hemerythrin-like domain-containing protein